MPYLYRIEVPNTHEGMYSKNGPLQPMNYTDICVKLNLWERITESLWVINPTPQNDIGLQDIWNELPDPDEYYFGFASLEQLKAWTIMDEVREHLAQVGYVVAELEVREPDYILGDKQVVFKKYSANYTRVIPWEEL